MLTTTMVGKMNRLSHSCHSFEMPRLILNDYNRLEMGDITLPRLGSRVRIPSPAPIKERLQTQVYQRLEPLPPHHCRV